jgi:hypothetical protein
MGHHADAEAAWEAPFDSSLDWVCHQTGDPLVWTITNRDLTSSAWTCQPLPRVVEVAKWAYYASRVLRFLEEAGATEPGPI